MIVKIPRFILRKYLALFGDRSYNDRKLHRITTGELYEFHREHEEYFTHPKVQHRRTAVSPRTDVVPLYNYRLVRNEPELRPVPVIAPGRFSFGDPALEKHLNLPVQSRVVSVRPTRNSRISASRSIYFTENDDRRRPETHRKRQDKKVPGLYRRALRFADRTYGTYGELAEIAQAFQDNTDLPAILSALAINEAVDRAYGLRARFLRDQLYSRAWYILPVGIDFAFSPFQR